MTDTQCTPTQCHQLLGKWDLYYHLPHDKNWDLASYKIIASKIETMETVIALNETIPESIVKYTMIFIMREGITPQWEDPKNRTGGAFSFKVINRQVHEVWKSLFNALCGETLFENKEINPHVNGITVSPKKNFCIVKIWLNSCKYQDPSSIINIPNIQKQGFRHHPSYRNV